MPSFQAPKVGELFATSLLIPKYSTVSSVMSNYIPFSDGKGATFWAPLSNWVFSNVGVIQNISSSSSFTNFVSAAQMQVSSLVAQSITVVGANTFTNLGTSILNGPNNMNGAMFISGPMTQVSDNPISFKTISVESLTASSITVPIDATVSSISSSNIQALKVQANLVSSQTAQFNTMSLINPSTGGLSNLYIQDGNLYYQGTMLNGGGGGGSVSSNIGFCNVNILNTLSTTNLYTNTVSAGTVQLSSLQLLQTDNTSQSYYLNVVGDTLYFNNQPVGSSASVSSNIGFSNVNIVDTLSTSSTFVNFVSAGGIVAGAVLADGFVAREIMLFPDTIRIGTILEVNPESKIAIGYGSGVAQENGAIAIGASAGQNSQGPHTVAIGYAAGEYQEDSSISIGHASGKLQASFAVAIGRSAGGVQQDYGAVAIGAGAGVNQKEGSIAIGLDAGGPGTIGSNAIAIGSQTGYNVDIPASTIILNATGADLHDAFTPYEQGALYIAPLRNQDTTLPQFSTLFYNNDTKEVVLGNAAGAAVSSNLSLQTLEVNSTLTSFGSTILVSQSRSTDVMNLYVSTSGKVVKQTVFDAVGEDWPFIVPGSVPVRADGDNRPNMTVHMWGAGGGGKTGASGGNGAYLRMGIIVAPGDVMKLTVPDSVGTGGGGAFNGGGAAVVKVNDEIYGIAGGGGGSGDFTNDAGAGGNAGITYGETRGQATNGGAAGSVNGGTAASSTGPQTGAQGIGSAPIGGDAGSDGAIRYGGAGGHDPTSTPISGGGGGAGWYGGGGGAHFFNGSTHYCSGGGGGVNGFRKAFYAIQSIYEVSGSTPEGYQIANWGYIEGRGLGTESVGGSGLIVLEYLTDALSLSLQGSDILSGEAVATGFNANTISTTIINTSLVRLTGDSTDHLLYAANNQLYFDDAVVGGTTVTSNWAFSNLTVYDTFSTANTFTDFLSTGILTATDVEANIVFIKQTALYQSNVNAISFNADASLTVGYVGGPIAGGVNNIRVGNENCKNISIGSSNIVIGNKNGTVDFGDNNILIGHDIPTAYSLNDGLYINPIRTVPYLPDTLNMLGYDPTTYEITSGAIILPPPTSSNLAVRSLVAHSTIISIGSTILVSKADDFTSMNLNVTTSIDNIVGLTLQGYSENLEQSLPTSLQTDFVSTSSVLVSSIQLVDTSSGHTSNLYSESGKLYYEGAKVATGGTTVLMDCGVAVNTITGPQFIKTVPFNITFPAKPAVFTQYMATGANDPPKYCSVYDISETQFKIQSFTNSGFPNAGTFFWQAVSTII